MSHQAPRVFFEDSRVRITSDNLNLPHISHGFFTRIGGISPAPHNQLNCGFGAKNDNPAFVAQNRAFVAGTLCIAANRLITNYQTHSATVNIVNEPWSQDKAPEGDALVSRIEGLALGILTADCSPLLLADTKAGIIGAAHSGWRGTKANILSATVEAMVELGATKANIALAIGPTISQDNYEVGHDFFEDFMADNEANQHYFYKNTKTNKYQFDMPGFIVGQANTLGLGSVHNLGLCTYGDEARFFSYRRAQHRNEDGYGRLMACIALTP